MAVYKRGERWHYAAMKVNALSIQTDAHKKLRAAIANATGDDRRCAALSRSVQ